MIKVFDHLWLKIIAVILGLLLWFHVATNKTYNHQLTLPINVVVLAEGLSLTQAPPESLTVTVSATGKQLLRQKWRERGLRVTATQFGPGRHRLELNPSNTSLEHPAGAISLDEIIAPNSVVLDVDRLAEAEFRVVPDIITEPDDGFAVSDISLTGQPVVTVTGPRSLVLRLKSVSTEQKELQGIRNNITLKLAVNKPDIYGVTVKPDSVLVAIRVVPVKTRVFENVPVVVYNSPVGQPVNVVPPSIRVEVTGPPAEIDLLNKNTLIVSADFNEADESGRAPVKINCPSKFKIRDASTDSVTISVQ